ncbi:copper homeostasis protein CutC [Facklamia sp. DSM 111018]|uniref:PF03932 family protein CutC n=1 Tax=Facklamia lactis TaxID=2749967 RepID=A0ABS0LT26_9LACT|nr:copper homeostasis protein CutC [Facklamia lactis]MBG9979460.1 copper homeostasis protein CutC [Facklamia lactis]MBG9987325.1 copper homeostasis protein CutC [Facklamia lactis]
MKNNLLIEVCAGSLKDCLIAQEQGADRIELNSGLFLGGLTPSLGTLIAVKQEVEIPIICMVRPRGGGFHYHDEDLAVIFKDAELLLENGADGIAFGFLTADGQIDQDLTERMIQLCHSYGKEAVFHRALDCSQDYQSSLETLIRLHCDRVLTSGGYAKVSEGIPEIAEYHQRYGDQIEFCLGSGITDENIEEIAEKTGVPQLHGSFKKWEQDPTTSSHTISFAYSQQGDYDEVDPERLARAVAKAHRMSDQH